jgi:hypothetical protein
MFCTPVVIDTVRKDGLVFASDFSDCDHSSDGYRQVMFRTQEPLVIGAAYSFEYESEEPQKPVAVKSRSGKTTRVHPRYFYHKVRNFTLIDKNPDVDLLFDL